MTQTPQPLEYTRADMSKAEIAARGQEMSYHVRMCLSHMRTGMRIQPKTLLPRLPESFLKNNYPDENAVFNGISTVLRALTKEGALMKMSADEFMLHQEVALTEMPPANKTKAACLYLRDCLIEGQNMQEIMDAVPDDLRDAYASEISLRTAFKMIVNRIIDMSETEFATFYESLDSDRRYASPFQGMGSLIPKSD